MVVLAPSVIVPYAVMGSAVELDWVLIQRF